NFDHVHRVACCNFEATGADAARIGRRALHAIEAAGENACDRCLAGAALAGEDVAMRQAASLNGVRQGFLNVLLPDEFAEILRTILSRDYLIHAVGKRNWKVNARPRVIRGTRAKSLPLLSSEPGGVCNRPLHEARSLTIHNRSITYFRSPSTA